MYIGPLILSGYGAPHHSDLPRFIKRAYQLVTPFHLILHISRRVGCAHQYVPGWWAQPTTGLIMKERLRTPMKNKVKWGTRSC